MLCFTLSFYRIKLLLCITCFCLLSYILLSLLQPPLTLIANYDRLVGAGRRHILLLCYFRGGSSYAAELISSPPTVFELFEPLFWVTDYKRDEGLPRPGRNSEDPARLRLVRQLFECNFKYLEDEFEDKLRSWSRMFFKGTTGDPFNSILHGMRFSDEAYHRNQSRILGDITAMCQHYPVTTIKTIRLPLSDAHRLLRNPGRLNPYIVHVVRDPRAMAYSQQQFHKMYGDSPGKVNVSVLCNSMRRDILESKQIVGDKELSERYTLVRYEDLASMPHNVTRAIHERLGIGGKEAEQAVGRYVDTHNHGRRERREGEAPEFFNTNRNADDVINAWKHKIHKRLRQKVDRECEDVIKYMKY